MFLCLSDTAAVEDAVFGPTGVAAGARNDAVLVNFSSIKPEAIRARAERLPKETGMHWIDAPVSGSDADVFARVEPHVLKMVQTFTLKGPTGAGQTTQRCNQVIVGCTMAALAEATRLAVNADVDASCLPGALAGGFADSKPLQLFVPRMVKEQHNPPLGHVYTMLTDLDSVRYLPRDCTSPAPFTSQASE